ncbi:MAG: PAS domain S-box protein [Bacteroidetes bacterium]|nr:PAS domain S-box protein [Bacteroidota bacterium]
MEKELLREQRKFEAVFQNASLGIVVIDESATIVLANNFLLQQFDYDNAAELIGKKLEILIPDRYQSTHVHDRNNFIKHPATRPMGMGRDLFGITKKNKEIPLEISLSSYSNEEGVFSIAFISDITARLEVQNKLREQRLALAAMNEVMEKKVKERTATLQDTMAKLEASKDQLTLALSKEKDLGELKSAFVSMASHEFRTPLSTILSSASLLAKYKLTEDQEKRDKHVQRIKSSVINLTNILNEFLSLGKIEEGKIKAHFSVFNIKEFIEQQWQEMSALFKPGQELEFTHTGKEIVTLDENLFKNILINLLSNASKFSSENKKIFINVNASDRELIFTIKDKGIGISDKDQEHLFEIFFRAKNALNIAGTGLGLHIVSKYTEIMNGNISIKSVLGEGTEITIKFIQ